MSVFRKPRWESKMPSATDESREAMRKMFGNLVCDREPHDFLRSHGYTDKAGMLRPPKPDHMVTTDEWACIEYLCDEWDYGFDPELPL